MDFSFNKVLQYMIFYVWLLSPNRVVLKVIQTVACITTYSLSLLKNILLYKYTSFYLFTS